MAHVWRNCFHSKQDVHENGVGFVRSLWGSVSAAD